MKFVAKFLCYLLDHRYGAVEVGPPQMIRILCHQIDGTLERREIPGFVRSKICERCGFPKVDIVFTPKKKTPEPSGPSRWLN